METGLYSLAYSIDTTDFSDINGCGLNPDDGIIYCSVKIGNNDGRLVKLDPDRLKYIAIMPYSAAAAFASDGTPKVYTFLK